MCGGIAIARDSVPDVLAEELQDHIATREGVSEIRFQYRDKVPLLPVWRDREFLIVPWGREQKECCDLCGSEVEEFVVCPTEASIPDATRPKLLRSHGSTKLFTVWDYGLHEPELPSPR